MSRNMRKPTKWLCPQRRLRSAWASAQSDQSFRCPHGSSLDPLPPFMRVAKSLNRLGKCQGCSESTLGPQPLCWFSRAAAHLYFSLLCKDTPSMFCAFFLKGNNFIDLLFACLDNKALPNWVYS